MSGSLCLQTFFGRHFQSTYGRLQNTQLLLTILYVRHLHSKKCILSTLPKKCISHIVQNGVYLFTWREYFGAYCCRSCEFWRRQSWNQIITQVLITESDRKWYDHFTWVCSWHTFSFSTCDNSSKFQTIQNIPHFRSGNHLRAYLASNESSNMQVACF